MPSLSIAVLPFADLSAEKDQRYFCDGLATELITALSRIEGLRVAPRSSSFRFRAVDDAQEAGRQLGVSAVLEGSVGKADGRLRVRAKLTRVRTTDSSSGPRPSIALWRMSSPSSTRSPSALPTRSSCASTSDSRRLSSDHRPPTFKPMSTTSKGASGSSSTGAAASKQPCSCSTWL